MPNKLPFLIIILVIIFLITSLLSFITVKKVVTPEKAAIEKTTSTGTADVVISIRGPPEPPAPPKQAEGNVLLSIVNKNQ